MITPIIIQIVFWLGVAACFVQGGMLIVGSFAVQAERTRASLDREERGSTDTEKKAKAAAATSFSAFTFAGGVAIIVLGPLMIRLYCELLILLFKIHEELKVANDRRGRT
ncbi:MAG: DUF4282 domain-containing protein [Planctomycetes bacterium]|nr:DUF4282 domain-containing protein [Planctomycetota bacterium]